MLNQKTITLVLVLTVLGLAVCSSGFANEKRSIDGITKEFVPGEDSGFFYTIKKGDTLWDLSQKFYNSEWDWPGLWELNNDIKNPHWIYPGRKIRIFLKERAPLKPKVVEVKKLPKKVPVKVKPSFSFSEMDKVGFIRKSEQESLGEVIKEQDGNLMMSKDDIIYIKPSGEGTLVPGRDYHIFTADKVKEKIDKKTFTGIKHLIKARVKILEHKVSYATAVITHSYRPVGSGDMVMDYFKRDSVLTVEEKPAPIDARIVCSEDNHMMINDYIIAFIDKGKDRVKPGEIYSVLRKNELKDNSLWPQKKTNQQIKLEDLESGKLIVLHTEDISSTVMILSSKYAISPNDMVN